MDIYVCVGLEEEIQYKALNHFVFCVCVFRLPTFFSRAARNDSVVPRLKNCFPAAAAAAAHFSIRRRSSLINVPALSHFLLIDTGNDDWCD
jgi:hypothetical protein